MDNRVSRETDFNRPAFQNLGPQLESGETNQVIIRAYGKESHTVFLAGRRENRSGSMPS